MTKPSPRSVPLAKATAERARLLSAQSKRVELANAHAEGSLLDAAAVEAAWSGILRGVRASMLAVSSRCASRLPHLSKHDVAEIDLEIRAALTEIAGTQ